jgi:hypothetical protein
MANEPEIGLFGEETQFIPTPAPVAETPPPAPEPVAEPAPVAVKPEEPKGEKDASPASERPRDENGRFKPRDDDEPMVPLKAMLSERERRQAAEKAAEALKAAQPAPDIWADPNAYIEHKLAEREPTILAKAEETARAQFFTYTENAARTRHASDSVKYDDARLAFSETAQNNPLMQQQLRAAPDPGEFIYQQGKIALELKEVGGDLSKYRERIETQARQKWEKEAEERTRRNANIPVSLNSEPSKGAGVTGNPGWAGPTSDSDIFPER